jgi:hypothetical protein
MHSTCSAYPFLYSVILIISDEEHKLWSFEQCNFFPAARYFVPVLFKYPPRQPQYAPWIDRRLRPEQMASPSSTHVTRSCPVRRCWVHFDVSEFSHGYRSRTEVLNILQIHPGSSHGSHVLQRVTSSRLLCEHNTVLLNPLFTGKRMQ